MTALWKAALGVGVAVLLASCAKEPPPVEPPRVDVRAELRKHGEWIVVAPWGKVWHPHATEVGQAFMPYVTGGGWVYGKDGWVFESKWYWGQWVFHTGRWFSADDLGWLWWPDPAETWGPAWVEWRTGDGHVGWAPLPPEVRGARHETPPWTYVKLRYASAREVEKFALKPPDAAKVHANTQPLPASGPDSQVVQAAGGMDRDPPSLEPVEVPAEAPPVEAAPEPAPEPAPAPPPAKKGKKPKKRK
ncbi:MAG: hypothetical protein AMXMBFR34_33430 [Myxococcaceae bacterium]